MIGEEEKRRGDEGRNNKKERKEIEEKWMTRGRRRKGKRDGCKGRGRKEDKRTEVI